MGEWIKQEVRLNTYIMGIRSRLSVEYMYLYSMYELCSRMRKVYCLRNTCTCSIVGSVVISAEW